MRPLYALRSSSAPAIGYGPLGYLNTVPRVTAVVHNLRSLPRRYSRQGEGGEEEDQSGTVRAGQGGHASPAEYAYDDDEVEVAGYMEETPVVGDAQAGGGTGEAIEPVTPPRAQTPPGSQPLVNEVGTGEQVVPLDVSGDPYPESRAAVHHLMRDGWMYQLRFDHGVTSAGLVLPGAGQERNEDPAMALKRHLDRYPSIAAQFECASAVRPVAKTGRLQYRRARAAGRRWALLPHALAFYDALFSPGLAWSVLGVERLAELLLDKRVDRTSGLDKYATLLGREADHLERLMAGAYALLGDFGDFVPYSQLYFVAASYQETAQRLLDPPAGPLNGWAWQGFLGAEDPLLGDAVATFSRRALERRRRRAAGEIPSAAEFAESIAAATEPRNVAGLFDPARRNLYPADPEVVRRRASLLGLVPSEFEARASRLRSPATFSEATRGRLDAGR